MKGKEEIQSANQFYQRERYNHIKINPELYKMKRIDVIIKNIKKGS